MLSDHSFWRSDLAEEQRARGARLPTDGISYTEETEGKIRISRLHIEKKDAARLCGRDPGSYVTVSFGSPLRFDEEERKSCAEVIARELSTLIDGYMPDDPPRSILAVGLGNRRLASDAVGPAVVSKITVTGHLRRADPLLSALGGRRVFAFAPGVAGDSGMESAEQTKGVCRCCKPDALVVIDALAAGDPKRLCSTVQLTDAGIAPGSGVGNDRPAFDRRFFGIPVFALGVPTVVDSSCLVSSFFEEAGVSPESLPPAVRSALDNGGGFFVSPKEIDAAVEIISEVLADAIDRALQRAVG